MAQTNKNVTLLVTSSGLWRFFVGPMFGQTCWTSLNSSAHIASGDVLQGVVDDDSNVAAVRRSFCGPLTLASPSSFIRPYPTVSPPTSVLQGRPAPPAGFPGDGSDSTVNPGSGSRIRPPTLMSEVCETMTRLRSSLHSTNQFDSL